MNIQRIVYFSLTIFIFPHLAFATTPELKPNNTIEDIVIKVEAASNKKSALNLNTEEQKQETLKQASATSTLDANDYLKGNAAGQADILKRIPGVFVQSNNGADDVRISVRGSGLSSRSFGRGLHSFQDGIPLGRIDSGTIGQLVDILAYDHLEVLRGASGMKLGAASLGGAINYHSRTGKTASPFQARLTMGEYGFTQSQLSLAGANEKNTADYYVSISHLHSDGYRENQVVNNNRLNANIGFQLNDHIENRTYLIIADADTELAGAISKENLHENRHKASPRSISVNADRNWQDLRLANQTAFQYGKHTTRVNAFGTYTVLDHLPTPYTGIIDNEYTQAGLGVNYAYNGEKHRFDSGIRLARQDNNEARYRFTKGGINKTDKTYDADFFINQTELFFEHEYQATDKLALISGVKYVDSNREFTDHIINSNLPIIRDRRNPQPNPLLGDQSYDVIYSSVNPRLGLRYEWKKDAFIFTNIAQSSETPNSSELSTRVANDLPSLKQQTATTWELGTKAASKNLQWEATYYHSLINNELLDNTKRFAVITKNYDKTRHEGIELGVQWQLAHNLFNEEDSISMNTVYNWSNFTIEEDAEKPSANGKKLPKVPTHTAFLTLDYQASRHWLIQPNIRFVDETETTYSNTGGTQYRTDAYLESGLLVRYNADNGFSAFIDGRNLGDITYASSASVYQTPRTRGGRTIPFASVYPSQGRTVFLGVEYSY